MGRRITIYLGTRFLQSLLVLWVIVTILFLLFRLAPGNPLVAYIDPTFTAEQQDELMSRFGLDQPLPVQYVVYLGNLVQGDFGDSFFQRAPVGEIVMEVLPNTLYLTLTSLILAYIIGVIGGIILAWQRGTAAEQAGVTFTLMTRSAPEFWVGMILLAIFAFRLQWLPSSGASSAGVIYTSELDKLTSLDFWQHMILPATTLALYLHGLPLLLMRSNMLEIMQDDFVTMGRFMGYSEWRLMVRRVARNALLPVVTAMALGIGYSIGGNVVIENVFGWPGLGRTLVRAVSANDYPLAQGAFLLIAVVMVLMNFFADMLYGLLDPRIGATERSSS
ncbi:MAG: ABC transporter permease [Candidatus Promineifilaceae bacterium]|nr:ABC transporter permease [Candidatus Promineifilaceae bacterium]